MIDDPLPQRNMAVDMAGPLGRPRIVHLGTFFESNSGVNVAAPLRGEIHRLGLIGQVRFMYHYLVRQVRVQQQIRQLL